MKGILLVLRRGFVVVEFESHERYRLTVSPPSQARWNTRNETAPERSSCPSSSSSSGPRPGCNNTPGGGRTMNVNASASDSDADDEPPYRFGRGSVDGCEKGRTV